jgi:3-oxoacyl-[acyl-carrier protein] reductase
VNQGDDVERQTILVTGGTRGLGLAIVARLADQGYEVIATGRKQSRELCEYLDRDDLNGKVHFEELDLAESAKIKQFIGNVTRQYGAIYGLVNNAAMGLDGVLATMHESEIEQVIRVNLTGSILMAKYAGRSMMVQREGRIINIASVVANTGYSGLSVYAATKAGLIGFTKSLSRELGKVDITVNSISPGFMETDMTSSMASEALAKIKRRSPMGRLPQVGDVASMIAYLLGDEASSITGADFVIDAGNSA